MTSTRRLHRKPPTAGFTLIEAMVTVAIIAIIATVAVPSYSEYVVRGKIPEATSLLSTKQVQMEQFFQDNRTYVGGAACTADSASSKYFDFSCSGVSATAFTLTATGKSSMAAFSYTVNQSGAKSSAVTGLSGWSGSSSCWVTKKGGTC